MFRIGLAWAGIWLAAAFAITLVIGFVDPDSIDPGDTQGMMMVFGSMGFLSGAFFSTLSSLAERGTPPGALPLSRVLRWGLLASALAQIPYLGHGDAGLAANIGQALLFTVFGGLMALLWFFIVRRGQRGQSQPNVPAVNRP